MVRIVSLILTCLLAGTLGSYREPFRIQNSQDDLYLTNLAGHRNLCEKLSPVTTEPLKVGPTAMTQNWTIGYFGDDPNSAWSGIHLTNADSTMSEVTYDVDYPPYCFPIYYDYAIDLKAKLSTIKNRKKGLCLISKGAGERVQLAKCEEGLASQLWKLQPLSTEN